MATINASDQAHANRLASMTRGAASGPATDPEARAFEGRSRLKEAAAIRRDRIVPDPAQPRTEFDPDDLERLAGMAFLNGIPIRVEPIGGQRQPEAKAAERPGEPAAAGV
jgi:ParB family chromosome partitioning protein